MHADLLIKGFFIGFSIAAPVGPIGILCIQRTLAGGRLYGLISGLGAATADSVYGCVAGFGLTLISSLLVSQQAGLRLAGGLFLCYLGLKTFYAPPAGQAARTHGGGLGAAYASTFFLTLTNPLTILSFAAIFAGTGAAAAGSYLAATILVLGVFCGSACWWLLLSGGVSIWRDRLEPGWLRWVNRISGAAITVFGLLALASLFA